MVRTAAIFMTSIPQKELSLRGAKATKQSRPAEHPPLEIASLRSQ
jgi:hypothetical protein